MLLTISTTHQPATDLGYLLHKNPERVHEHELAFGRALLFYPEVGEARTTAALALDIDPIALVRGKGRGDRSAGGIADQYVNDRPYVASSFLSVAIAKLLRSALNGTSKERPGLAETPIPLAARVLPLPVRGDEGLIEALFAPLGYEISARPIALDPELANLGEGWHRSPYVELELQATVRLADLLSHLYVLIPVLDRKKHYFVDRHEIEKLVEKGGAWLAAHPARQLIATRYLRHKRAWAREALERLAIEDAIPEVLNEDAVIDTVAVAPAPASDGLDVAPPVAVSLAPPAGTSFEADAAAIIERPRDAAETALEAPIRLHDLRLATVAATLKAAGARRVVDLGCGSGKLLARLMADKQFTDIVGLDVATASLEIAARRLRLDRLPERQRKRITLLQGALTYRDRRLEGYDAVAMVEVIEHLEPDRLPAFERALFEFARPALVVLTTPNVEYNAVFAALTPGSFRHADHRFEWTRGEFADWSATVADRFGYKVAISGIGPADARFGSPSQMAVFTLEAAA